MSTIRTIAVCLPRVPFARGGAELLVESLVRELRARDYRVDTVSVPFHWEPKTAFLDQALAWRMVDLERCVGERIDRVIATKFPSYTVEHPDKVTWLTHQFRQVYDLFGTPWSHFDRSPDDLGIKEAIRRIDCRTLSESRHLYAISKNVAERARTYNGLDAEVLYPPPPRGEAFEAGPYGDYILSVGRLDAMKRVAPLLRALPHTDPALRCVIAGSGPDEEKLRALAEELGVSARVDFAGGVPFRTLVELMAGCRGVYFAPYDEDYGYVTLEAFLARKPVITAPDAGGPLEFVTDGETGIVVQLEPEPLAEGLTRLFRDVDACAAMGNAGHARAAALEWDPVIDALVKP